MSEAKSHEEMSKLILQMGDHGRSDEGIAYLGGGECIQSQVFVLQSLSDKIITPSMTKEVYKPAHFI